MWCELIYELIYEWWVGSWSEVWVVKKRGGRGGQGRYMWELELDLGWRVSAREGWTMLLYKAVVGWTRCLTFK